MADSGLRKSQSLSKLCGVCGGRYANNVEKCPTDGAELTEVGTDMIGTLFAKKYEITNVLGEGGMSLVYKAQHKLMERTVALKVLRKHLVADAVAMQRFTQESQAAASLAHPNIVTVYDFGLEDGQAFFVMDCLEGPTLADVIAEKGHLSTEEAVPIFAGICAGLAHAHEKGVIHRDLKPSNIVLMPQKGGGRLVKIVDFGIAKVLPVEGKVRQQLTQTGEVFGSPLYMSPEQCIGKNPDQRSDIYSLGCLMYETLSGMPPLMGDTAFETMTKHVNQMPLTFGKLDMNLNVPSEIEAIVFKCLQKEPDHRFQTVTEVLAALPADKSSTPKAPVQIVLQAPKQNWWASKSTQYGIAGVLIPLGVAAWCFFFFEGPPQDRGTPFNKFMWNCYMTLGDWTLKNDQYQSSARYFDLAAKQTDYLNSAEKRLHALEGEKDAYGHLSDDTKVTEISNRILSIKKDNARSTFNDLLSILKKAKDGGTLNKSLSDAAVRLANVHECALTLQGYHLYDEEEALLKLALDQNVYPRALGPNKTDKIAELWTMLAKCYQVQQKMKDAADCYKNADRLYVNVDDDSLQAISADLQLGEFYKDQNKLEDSKNFLEPALKKASANLDKPWGRKVYAHCLRAYGDLLDQSGHASESAKDIEKALQIEKDLRATGKDPEDVSLP